MQPGNAGHTILPEENVSQDHTVLMWSNNQDTKLISKMEVFGVSETKIYPQVEKGSFCNSD